jgi:hypothetical protein
MCGPVDRSLVSSLLLRGSENRRHFVRFNSRPYFWSKHAMLCKQPQVTSQSDCDAQLTINLRSQMFSARMPRGSATQALSFIGSMSQTMFPRTKCRVTKGPKLQIGAEARRRRVTKASCDNRWGGSPGGLGGDRFWTAARPNLAPRSLSPKMKDRQGSSCNAGCTKSQPRRQIATVNRDDTRVRCWL